MATVTVRLLIPGVDAPHSLTLPISPTLSYLTTATKALPSIPETHILRFIHAGKLLTTLTHLPSNAVIHVALTPPPTTPHVTLDLDDIPLEQSPRTDWLAGFCMGVLMGLIMLVLTQDRTIALSRKCRTGVSIGAAINIVFGLTLLFTDR